MSTLDLEVVFETTPEIVVTIEPPSEPFEVEYTDPISQTADLEDHINSPNPHPVYDDGPSLELLYANAKV